MRATYINIDNVDFISTEKNRVPEQNEPMAKFIDRRLHELSDRKNQREIADRAGYTNPNMITHLKTGSSKVSLDRVPDLAAALEVDPKLLLKKAILQYVSEDKVPTIAGLLNDVATDNELALLDFIRQVNGGKDVALNDRTKTAIKAAFGALED
jgi:transcriptional regulator with XRE-family HTH domain